MRIINLLLISSLLLLLACEQDTDSISEIENNSTTLLKAIPSDSPLLGELMGSQVKSSNQNSGIEYEHPWLFQNDTLQRLVFCTEKSSTWKDEKVIYGIKDGEHIAYRIERIYLDNCPIGSKEIPIEAITRFTGILNIYSLDYEQLYKLYYVEDKLIETKSYSNTSKIKRGGNLPKHVTLPFEVQVIGKRHRNTGFSTWSLQNNGRYNLNKMNPRSRTNNSENNNRSSSSDGDASGAAGQSSKLEFQLELFEKLDCIRALLEQNSVFKDVLSKFYSGETNLNLIWKIDYFGNDTKDKNGITLTDTGKSSDITILINGDKIGNRSTIEVARTMLHEAIHAELWRRVKEQILHLCGLF